MSQERQPLAPKQQDEKPASPSAARQVSPRSQPSASTLHASLRPRISSPDSSGDLDNMSSTRQGKMSSETASMSTSSKHSPSRRSSNVDSNVGGSYVDSPSHRKSLFSSAVEKTKAKFTRRPSASESLAGGEEEYERREAKETKKQMRKEEYERLGLGDRTRFGMQGAGRWDVG